MQSSDGRHWTPSTNDGIAVVAATFAGHGYALSDDQAAMERAYRTVLQHSADGHLLWWTWAGTAANHTLHATLAGLVDPHQRLGDRAVRMRRGSDPRDLADALRAVDPSSITGPTVHDGALTGLKFAAALPVELARATLASRFADRTSAQQVLSEDMFLIQ